MEYCSYIWDGDPRPQWLNMLDRVQKRVVSLLGPGLSDVWHALSHRRDVYLQLLLPQVCHC